MHKNLVAPTGADHRSIVRHRLVVAMFLATAVLVSLPGCSGCRAKRDKSQPAKPVKPKDDFELLRLSTLPNAVSAAETMVKPGHWIGASVDLLANNFDAVTELAVEPVSLPGLPYRLICSRPAVLSKSQRKSIETLFFLPTAYAQQSGGQAVVRPGWDREAISVSLERRVRGRALAQGKFPLTIMAPHQFYMMVLSRQPDRFQFLRTLPAIAGLQSGLIDPIADAHYRVLLPAVERDVPLPLNPLAWTSLSVLLWDDLDPAAFSPAQQQACVDWLHWGGQIVVSGPAALDTLRGSFLAPYLPATTDATRELTADDFADWAERWRTPQPPMFDRAISAAVLVLTAGAKTLAEAAAAPILVERAVGRGRVVASAVALGQRELLIWPGYDALFNACVLRRPPRFYRADPVEGGVDKFQIDEVGYLSPSDKLHGNPNAFTASRSPALNSRLRFFTRDARATGDFWKSLTDTPLPGITPSSVPDADPFSMQNAITASSQAADVARWSDDSHATVLAIDALRNAAGIAVPNRRFVLKVLGVYLLVLVPVNWCVFRLFRRVEWAWLATPIIAIVAAVAVARLAQLDVGFARARIELAVLEFQPEYPRAHASRYTALYSSLSTRFSLKSENAGTLILPMATGSELLRTQSLTDVMYRQTNEVSLDRFFVVANSVSMLRSEAMLDAQGAFEYKADDDRVLNHTKFDLAGAAIIGPEQRMAWLGDLPAGAGREVHWQVRFDPATKSKDPVIGGQATTSVIQLSKLWKFAESYRRTGEVLLLGWHQEQLEGLEIEPAPSQARQANLVVAHLNSPIDPSPAPDHKPLPVAETGRTSDE